MKLVGTLMDRLEGSSREVDSCNLAALVKDDLASFRLSAIRF